MAKFGNTSLNRLFTCHKDLMKIMEVAISDFDISVVCGHRNESEQNRAYDAGQSQLAFPHSSHNQIPSMAIDIAPYCLETKGIDWDDSESFVFMAGYVKRVADELFKSGQIHHRLRWGGDWNMNGRTVDEKFRDYPHFELIQAA
jgi:peptidoglycan L-alanyl-D-glutamate endopeptidase CwlK